MELAGKTGGVYPCFGIQTEKYDDYVWKIAKEIKIFFYRIMPLDSIWEKYDVVFLFCWKSWADSTGSRNAGQILKGRKLIVAVRFSQFFSNVPTTLLLSGFMKNYKELLLCIMSSDY